MNEKYVYLEHLGIISGDIQDSDIRDALKFFQEEILLRSGRMVEILFEEIQGGFNIILKRMQTIAFEEFELIEEKDKIIINANSKRGFLYGVSSLLKQMYLKKETIGILRTLRTGRTIPSYVMRGHQLGYRDKQNTCPAWTEVEYERYIRDLLIFGTNSIELLPPHTDDALYSSHFKRDPMKLMIMLSEIIHSYGLDVHVWYPYLSLSDEGAIFEEEMREREEVFSKVPYIDGLLVPTGDPGDLPPKKMIRMAYEMAKILHKYHPNAKVWLAPQSFEPTETWYDEFYEEIEKEPDWLYGVCFGPWEKDSIEEMYQKLPEKYKNTIRNYPDITHNISSQFEVPDWDEAFAYTLGRESYNARPYAFKRIHDMHKGYVLGSITYSEGIHDDVVKMIWGNLDYQDEFPVEEIIKDYVRVFIDPDLDEELSQVILNLEKSWEGKILENENIDCLYQKMKAIDQRVSEDVKDNYRYQMLLLRVLGDYQTKIRYQHDQELEKKAYEILGRSEGDSFSIIKEVRNVLNKTYTEPVGVEERFWMQRLSDTLYEKCCIQLTTSRHRGQATGRGAWLDTLNMALNDYQWIQSKLSRIEKLVSEEERKSQLRGLAHRCDPGEGGIYIHLGSPEGFQYVKKTLTWEEDPGFLKSPLMAHSSFLITRTYEHIGWYDEVPVSTKWMHGARTLYGTPLVVRVPDLDPDKKYQITVTYQNSLSDKSMDMEFYAGEELIHSQVAGKYKKGEDWDPTYTYELPPESYSTGILTLTWKTVHELGPCTVCELLLKEKI